MHSLDFEAALLETGVRVPYSYEIYLKIYKTNKLSQYNYNTINTEDFSEG